MVVFGMLVVPFPVAGQDTNDSNTTTQFDFDGVYNSDVVVGGDGEFSDGGFDGDDRMFVSQWVADQVEAENDSVSDGTGLPNDGTFEADAAIEAESPRFELAAFNTSGDNAWQTDGTESITVDVTDGEYEAIHIVAAAGGDADATDPEFAVEYTYSDGSTDTSETYTIPDWADTSAGSNDGDEGVYTLTEDRDRIVVEEGECGVDLIGLVCINVNLLDLIVLGEDEDAGYESTDDESFSLFGFETQPVPDKTVTEIEIDVTANADGQNVNVFGASGVAAQDDPVEPEFKSAVIDEPADEITVDFDANVTVDDPAQAEDDITVEIDGDPVAVTDVSDGTKDDEITVELDEAIVSGDDVEISYDDTNEAILSSDDGSPAQSFDGEPVSNDVEEKINPEFEDAVVDEPADEIDVTFGADVEIDDQTATEDAFTVKVDGQEVAIEDITDEAGSSTVTVEINQEVTGADDVSLAYTEDDNALVSEEDGSAVQSFDVSTDDDNFDNNVGEDDSDESDDDKSDTSSGGGGIGGGGGSVGDGDGSDAEDEAPSISSFDASSPSNGMFEVTLESDEELENISVSITGPENTTLTEDDFTEDDGTYTATYEASTGGTYTATLETAEDANGNDGADDQDASAEVSMTDDGSDASESGDEGDGTEGKTDSDTVSSSISAFNASSTDGEIKVSFTSDEMLEIINVSLTGPENTTLTERDFTEDDGNYTATYQANTDGIYTATLESAEDTVGTDHADNQTDETEVRLPAGETATPVDDGGVTEISTFSIFWLLIAALIALILVAYGIRTTRQ